MAEFVVARIPLVFVVLILLLRFCFNPIDIGIAFIVSLCFQLHTRFPIVLTDSR